MAQVKTRRSVFSNICPVCNDGRIFRGLFTMNKKCPSCGDVFEKEPGYFIGAMIASYFLGILLVAPTLVICLFGMEMETAPAITIGALQLLVMTPILFRYSRLMWIQIEYQLTHSIHAKRK